MGRDCTAGHKLIETFMIINDKYCINLLNFNLTRVLEQKSQRNRLIRTGNSRLYVR